MMTPTEQMMLELLREVAANSAVSPEIMGRVRQVVEEHGAQAEDEFRRLAPLVDADPDWYGRTFYERRKVFTVIGVNPHRPKNVMAVRDHTGKVFKSTVNYVRDRMPAAPTPAPRSRSRGGRKLDLGV